MSGADLVAAVGAALAPGQLAAALAGVLIGIVFGAIPGLTATLAIALFVPVSFVLRADAGLILLGGIYAGAIYGGSISAILVNIPGTPASIVTAWEGYAMARRGEAGYALGLSALASGFGGLLSALAMLFLTPTLAGLALAFGPAEFVALIAFSLAVVVAMLEGPMLATLAGCGIGLALATIGLDPVHGTPRFTFGLVELAGGVNLVAVLIGFFCMTQALVLAAEAAGRPAPPAVPGVADRFAARLLATFARAWVSALRSAAIGIGLGIMPAIGPESTPIVAHAVERRLHRGDEPFGAGSTVGLLAAETSVSANVGGSLIPLLSLGIPGSGAAAMFIGALTLHGLRPGPLLFVEHGPVVYAFLIGFLVANALMMAIGLFAVRHFAVVLRLPKAAIAVGVAFCSVLGAYATNNSLFDVGLMFAATAVAFLLRLAGIPLLPVVLALILGRPFEENLVVAAITLRSWQDLAARPIAVVLALAALAAIGLRAGRTIARPAGRAAR